MLRFPFPTTILLVIAACSASAAPMIAPFRVPAKPGELELYVPEKFSGVPIGNDYNNPDSEYSFSRSRSSPHFQLFWAKEIGVNPTANPEKNLRFNPEEVIAAAEKSYEVFLNELDWAPSRSAYARRFKFLIQVNASKDGTAYGSKVAKEVGAFWTPASRVRNGPYGVIAHELGHSFQALSRSDGAGSMRGMEIGEMTSQFMLWHVYPHWQDFENYHVKAFMKKTHLAFLHQDNCYHSCYPLENWARIHGAPIIGKLWREAKDGEDAVTTYQRVTRTNQERFNDEMFDGCRRFVTWDLPRVEKISAPHANQHFTRLDSGPDGWFGIVPELAPQNYGYNAIKLTVPAGNPRLRVNFRGKAGAPGFSQVALDKAGWRYGFLAHKGDGKRVYSPVFSSSEGVGEFTVPTDTKFLWLVVMGAPTEHQVWNKKDEAEQWPYVFKLDGTVPDPAMLR